MDMYDYLMNQEMCSHAEDILRAYSKTYGHLNINIDFVVSHSLLIKKIYVCDPFELEIYL